MLPCPRRQALSKCPPVVIVDRHGLWQIVDTALARRDEQAYGVTPDIMKNCRHLHCWHWPGLARCIHTRIAQHHRTGVEIPPVNQKVFKRQYCFWRFLMRHEGFTAVAQVAHDRAVADAGKGAVSLQDCDLCCQFVWVDPVIICVQYMVIFAACRTKCRYKSSRIAHIGLVSDNPKFKSALRRRGHRCFGNRHAVVG